jgi:hypothetical protein
MFQRIVGWDKFWKIFLCVSIASYAVRAFVGWHRGDKWDEVASPDRIAARARIENNLEKRRRELMREKETVEAKDLGAGETQ